jgi:hypothetical protein
MATSFLKTLKRYLYGSIPCQYLCLLNPDSPKIRYFRFIKENGYTRYPYDYAEKYLRMPVEVLPDHQRNLKYVMHTNNRKLYFPASFPDWKIEKLYKSLLIEQDLQSAHHYVDSMKEFEGRTILDIGSAEGLTSLEAIEAANFIYFFECQQEWISALNATFEPWKDKIMIVEKFVSNKNSGNSITLDEFFKDKPKENLFIKMDIEGEERHALEGAANVFLTSPNLQFAICTYHRRTDKKVISSFLDRYNCTYAPREGFFYTKHTFRMALIRGCSKIR